MRRIKQALVYLLNSAWLHVLKYCVFVQHDRLASRITALHLTVITHYKYLKLSMFTDLKFCNSLTVTEEVPADVIACMKSLCDVYVAKSICRP